MIVALDENNRCIAYAPTEKELEFKGVKTFIFEDDGFLINMGNCPDWIWNGETFEYSETEGTKQDRLDRETLRLAPKTLAEQDQAICELYEMLIGGE